jgi:hypothetical protein
MISRKLSENYFIRRENERFSRERVTWRRRSRRRNTMEKYCRRYIRDKRYRD